MRTVVKQVLGVDVGQKELVVCLGRMHNDYKTELYLHHAFTNSFKGFVLLAKWVEKNTDPSQPVRYVMEATGVYHELLAYFLRDQGFEVSIVLPNKISNYARSLDTKTVTDKTASEAIALFGLERHLNNWEKPSAIYKNMQQLTRERDQIVCDRTIAKNQAHAEKAGAEPNKSSLKRVEKRIALLDKQVDEINLELAALVKTDSQIAATVKLLCTIPGVGILTASTVLAETNGFNLIKNKRQLTSYAGLDIKEKQSGTSIKGKPRISKQGNRFLRKAMHMPALSAKARDERFKAVFVRLVSRHGIKMKAVVAVQRKLLEMMYTVFKTNKAYDKEHLQKQEKEQIKEAA